MSSLTNTDIERPRAAVATAARRTGRLGRKLVFQILLLNALLSIFASSIQLYASYQRDRRTVLEAIDVIDTSFRSGFQDALWEYNFPLVQALLEGVYTKPDVQFLTLSTGQGQTWKLGDPSGDVALMEKLTFQHKSETGQIYDLGRLEVGLTFERIRARVWSQLWTLLMSNFAKTVVASFLMFMLFQSSVGRHLSSIAARVSQHAWTDNADPLTLDRTPQDAPDDLDHIVNSINSARADSSAYLEKLTHEIAQRRSAEEALRHRTHALENANREQSQFTYAISHDLKSPANTIAMLLQELELMEGDRLSADSKDVLADANRTIARMTQLVEDILGYARSIEQGIQMEPVDLNTIVEEVLEDLRGDIVKAQAQFSVDDLPAIEGNRVQLRMLLQNLINNAIKFRDPARAPHIAITAVQTQSPQGVKIRVQDNGIGIDPAYHDRVFELFQRLHSYGEYDGSGLGLTLCKRIAINHMGDINVASVPGEGTTFEIQLPRGGHGH